MEILTHWRRSGARRWVLVVAPLIAAAIGSVLGAQSPLEYQATTVVQVPSFGSRALVVTDVAEFRALMLTPGAIEEASRASGLTFDDVSAVLDVRSFDVTNLVEVRATTNEPESAAAVTTTVAASALDRFVSTRMREPRELLAFAQARLRTAEASLRTFRRDHGVVFPDEEVRARSAELAQLKVEQSQATLLGETDRSTELEATIRQRQQELAELLPLAAEYDALAARVLQARQLIADAELEGERLAARLGEDDGVTSTASTQLPRRPAVVRAAAAAGVAALVVAIALLAAVESFSSRRAARSRGAGRAPDRMPGPDLTGVGRRARRGGDE